MYSRRCGGSPAKVQTNGLRHLTLNSNNRRLTGMSSALQTAPGSTALPAAWSGAKRIAFRFAFVYVLAYTFPFPFQPPDVQPEWLTALWRIVTPWVGAHIFHAAIRPVLGEFGD